jgi:hypothetical protein
VRELKRVGLVGVWGREGGAVARIQKEESRFQRHSVEVSAFPLFLDSLQNSSGGNSLLSLERYSRGYS